MLITTIVPTYRRPKDLKRCLEALKKQTRPADEVLVTVRDTDTETWAFLEAFEHTPLPLQTVTVKVPGVVAAMNAALDMAKGEIVAFTDDDAAPHSDWLERLEAYYADPKVGGVGGKDFVYKGNQLQQVEKQVVGKVQWFGRVIGNHHFGVGKAREVEVLKGVNMSFRRSAIAPVRFDERMLGSGAQVHFECSCCFTLKQAGWKLIYDPKIAVDHYPGQRFDEDQRHQFDRIATINQVHNETLGMLEYLSPLRRSIYLLWGVIIGTRWQRGFLQSLRFLPSEGSLSGKKLFASLQGRWKGWQSWRQGANKSLAEVVASKQFQ